MRRPETCNLCGAREGEVIYTADPKELLGVDLPPYPIVRCQECGLVYAEGQKDPEFLKRLYSAPYFDGGFKGGYVKYGSCRERDVQAAAERVRALERCAPQRGRILDVGCATGLFLEAARQAGWEPSGVEHSAFASAEARQHGLAVFTGTLREAVLPDSHFDATTFWAVIAHVADPAENIREACRVLKPGGVICLSTPNQEMFAESKNDWGAGWYRAPLQLYFFSAKTLSALLGRNGFECVRNLKTWADEMIEMIGFKRRVPGVAQAGRMSL